MILPLFPEEKMRLKRIDGNTIFALKKLFINATFKKPSDHEVNVLAAQRFAQDLIADVFHDLETLPSDATATDVRGNMV